MALFSKPATVGFVSSLALTALAIRQYGTKAAGADSRMKKLFVASGAAHRSGKVAVDSRFLRRLKRLLAIVCPGVLTPEFGFAALVAALLVARTYCDLWMIKMSTTIESAVIRQDASQFSEYLFKFVLGFLPIAGVNNLLKYGLAEMTLRFRKRLTTYLMGQYMKGDVYYQASNIDNRITNPDQLLTQDVERWCGSVVDLYSNLAKPVLDMAVYTYRLSHTIGLQGPGTMLSYLAVSGVLLTWLRRPIGRMTVMEQQIEGEYRYVNSRIITNGEEIAFYQGAKREHWVVSHTFDRLLAHLRRSQIFRYTMGVVDSLVAKYFATVVGFWVISRPAFGDGKSTFREGHMEDYYQSARMLINLAGAVGRLVLAGRELTRLAGFTARVDDLTKVLDDLNSGMYQRTLVGESSGGVPKSARAKIMQGEVVEMDNVIRFENVPLTTPNGDVLIKNLSFEVKAGNNVLIAGPNGSGKTSVTRQLGGLWPLTGGTVVRPSKSNLFYIPQRPYMTLGTLRDQVIYPHTKDDMTCSDDDLLKLLADVHLEYLVDREGGWDAVADFKARLSGGEQQRVAMSRVFYHRPQFAILDECTSAVSVDVEGFMYNRCRELNITLFTISHRKSLWRHHDFALELDGRGGYSFYPITEEVLGSAFGS